VQILSSCRFDGQVQTDLQLFTKAEKNRPRLLARVLISTSQLPLPFPE
jgi:hypothetical protein